MTQDAPAIHDKIQAYYGDMPEHDRYRSWEHCYRYFHKLTPAELAADRHHAALQLGFYLASWGMYRGSSFLLQYAYTAHLGAIDQLVAPRFSVLWEREFGAGEHDSELVPVILQAINDVREAYRPFAPASESRQASDTLVTKILLGTFGCLPACDRYFIDGFKNAGFRYSYLNTAFIERALRFCADCRAPFDEEYRGRIDRAAAGVVRGLLCPRCKAGVSRFRDDVERPQKAASYLAK